MVGGFRGQGSGGGGDGGDGGDGGSGHIRRSGVGVATVGMPVAAMHAGGRGGYGSFTCSGSSCVFAGTSAPTADKRRGWNARQYRCVRQRLPRRC